jgi:hypothetical protein
MAILKIETEIIASVAASPTVQRGYNHTVTNSIHEVASIKCGYWKTLKIFWIILILILFWKISSTQTINFSTLYTTIPHEKLKTCLKEIIHNALEGDITSI